jgi:serine/threonine protein phosphatase PrpC
MVNGDKQIASNTSILYTQTDLEHPEKIDFETGVCMAYTHRSPEKETVNEDCAALIPYNDEGGVLIIADGLGGIPGGETASKTAVNCLQKSIAAAAAENQPLREAILDGFENANKKILSQTTGAATTLAVVEIQGHRIRPYHVGDSMMLVTGQRGKKKLQSVAHSPVGYAVEAGMLDVDDAVHHEERHYVSNVVGATDMRIEIGAALRMARHDTLILASDGLFDNLYIDEIVEIIRTGNIQNAASELLQLARQRMAAPAANLPCHPDDLTFILFRRSQ